MEINNQVIIRERTLGNTIPIIENNLYQAVRSFKDARFWENLLKKQNIPYILVEGEATIEQAYMNGYFFFIKNIK